VGRFYGLMDSIRRFYGLMDSIQVGNELVNHAKDCAQSEHAGGNAGYCQQSANLVVPQVGPDFIPDNAHQPPRSIARYNGSNSWFRTDCQVSPDSLPSSGGQVSSRIGTVSCFDWERHLGQSRAINLGNSKLSCKVLPP
jgi:hypothetical protein